MKFFYLTLLLFISFTTINNTECIADVYTDDTYSSYFDVDNLATYYCADLITYPISEDTAITAQSRHKSNFSLSISQETHNE